MAKATPGAAPKRQLGTTCCVGAGQSDIKCDPFSELICTERMRCARHSCSYSCLCRVLARGDDGACGAVADIFHGMGHFDGYGTGCGGCRGDYGERRRRGHGGGYENGSGHGSNRAVESKEYEEVWVHVQRVIVEGHPEQATSAEVIWKGRIIARGSPGDVSAV